MPEPVFNISKEEWDRAREYFAKHPSHVKLKKNQTSKYSFIKADDTLYAIGALLGEGVYGKVKLVCSEKGEKYAVKIEGRARTPMGDTELDIIKELGEHQATMNRYYDVEGRNAKNYKGRETNVKSYTLVKLKEGVNLYNFYRKNIYPFLGVQNYIVMAKAVEAIQQMHAKGIIHGDIKLDNFMIQIQNGRTSISPIDFGFSKKVSLGEDLFFDTGVYDPNDQARHFAPELKLAPNTGNQTVPYSFASDLYALAQMGNDLFIFAGESDFYARCLDHRPSWRPTTTELLDFLIKKIQEFESTIDNIDVNELKAKYLQAPSFVDPESATGSLMSADSQTDPFMSVDSASSPGSAPMSEVSDIDTRIMSIYVQKPVKSRGVQFSPTKSMYQNIDDIINRALKSNHGSTVDDDYINHYFIEQEGEVFEVECQSSLDSADLARISVALEKSQDVGRTSVEFNAKNHDFDVGLITSMLREGVPKDCIFIREGEKQFSVDDYFAAKELPTELIQPSKRHK